MIVTVHKNEGTEQRLIDKYFYRKYKTQVLKFINDKKL